MRIIIAAAAVSVLLAGCGDVRASGAAATHPAYTSSTAMSGEDRYIDQLRATHLWDIDFPGDGRGLWIRKGLAACDQLEATHGDVVAVRFTVAEGLVDYGGQGWSEPKLADRAVAVVEAARKLCPDAPWNP